MPIYMNWGNSQPPKVKGDVDDPQHAGWIELTSLQFGTLRGISAPTGNSCDEPASGVKEIVITKDQDMTSHQFFQLSMHGEPVPVAVDFVTRDGPTPYVYLRLTLSGVLISGYSQGGNGRPNETMSLTYTKLEWGPAKGVTPHASVPPSFLSRSTGCSASR